MKVFILLGVRKSDKQITGLYGVYSSRDRAIKMSAKINSLMIEKGMDERVGFKKFILDELPDKLLNHLVNVELD